METTAKYRLMGAFTLIAMLGVFGFVYWLNHGSGLSERSTYQIKFLGAVPGLRPGASVQFNGIRVGEVTDLRLDATTPQQVMATISIDRATPVRADTQVSLDFQGLMGVTSVALKGGAPQSPSLPAADGSAPLLVAGTSAGSDLTATARDALHRLDGILADNSESLRGTIANLNTFTGALAKNSDKIDGIVAGLARMTGGDSAKSQTLLLDLTAPRMFPAYDKEIAGQLAVAEPTALLALDTQRVVLRSPSGSRTQIQGDAQWGDSLPKLVQVRIIQAIENATSPRAVARVTDNLSAERQLLIEIRSFEVVATDKPVATVELAAKLIGEGGRVLNARTFGATALADSLEAAPAAAALDHAFGKAATQLAFWVREVR